MALTWGEPAFIRDGMNIPASKLAQPPNQTGATRLRPGRRLALTQLLEMQSVLHADSINLELDPKSRAACACAWDKLEERKRILRNRPLPGSLKPEAKSKASKPSIIRPLPDEP